MRRLIESTFVRLDGVISSPEKWGAPYWNDEHNEFHFWLFPVAVGSGQRLFDGIDTTRLKLVETTTFSTGIVVLGYLPK